MRVAKGIAFIAIKPALPERDIGEASPSEPSVRGDFVATNRNNMRKDIMSWFDSERKIAVVRPN